MGKKGKKYPAHQIAKKKILDDQKSPVKWSAPYQPVFILPKDLYSLMSSLKAIYVVMRSFIPSVLLKTLMV